MSAIAVDYRKGTDRNFFDFVGEESISHIEFIMEEGVYEGEVLSGLKKFEGHSSVSVIMDGGEGDVDGILKFLSDRFECQILLSTRGCFVGYTVDFEVLERLERLFEELSKAYRVNYLIEVSASNLYSFGELVFEFIRMSRQCIVRPGLEEKMDYSYLADVYSSGKLDAIAPSENCVRYYRVLGNLLLDNEMVNKMEKLPDRGIFTESQQHFYWSEQFYKTAIIPKALQASIFSKSSKFALRKRQVCDLLSYFGLYKWFSLSVKNVGKKEVNQDKYGFVIGAYGGEHLGDAALLGGVLLRVKRDYGISRFIVLSVRASRTRSWVAKLRISGVCIEVDDIDNFRRIENEGGLLVYGGGPIMDMPVDHTRHLAIANFAMSKGIPFSIEGVGYGPFKSKYSRWVADELFSQAFVIRTRSNFGIVGALVDQDPAFDYLESLGGNHSIECEGERSYVTSFLCDLKSSGKSICGLNFRPIWHKYLADDDKAGSHEKRSNEVLKHLVLKYPDVIFLFLSYNCDHYGMSDLDLAYDLRFSLSKEEGYKGNFMIMSREVSPDGMSTLLKTCSSVIGMRFHACIFSLANKVPTLGVEYNTREGGKVEGLFRDRAEPNIVNVKDFNIEVASSFVSMNHEI